MSNQEKSSTRRFTPSPPKKKPEPLGHGKTSTKSEALVLDVKSHVDSHGSLPDQGTGNHGKQQKHMIKRLFWIHWKIFFHGLGIMAAVVMLADLEVDDLFFVQRLQVPSGSKMICFCMFLWCCWVILKRKEAWSPDKLLILFWFFLESVIQRFVPNLSSHHFGWERGRTSMFVFVNGSWIVFVASLVTLVTNPTICCHHDGKCLKKHPKNTNHKNVLWLPGLSRFLQFWFHPFPLKVTRKQTDMSTVEPQKDISMMESSKEDVGIHLLYIWDHRKTERCHGNLVANIIGIQGCSPPPNAKRTPQKTTWFIKELLTTIVP